MAARKSAKKAAKRARTPARRAAPKKAARRAKPVPAGTLVGFAERVVEKAMARGARAAEAFVVEERGTSLAIERGTISNGSVARELGLAVRLVAKNGALGFAFVTDPEDAERGIATALDAARVLPKAARFEFPDRARFPSVSGLHDKKVANLSVEDGVRACEAMMKAALKRAPTITIAGGGVGWGEERVAIANSTGVKGEYVGTRVGGSLNGVLREGGETTTGFEYGLSRKLDLDWTAIGRGMADLAVRSRNAKPIESGEMTVLFKPTAIDGLMEMLFVRAVLASSAAAKQSVYTGRIGEEILPRRYGVVDDGRLAGGRRSAPFDDEGVPTSTTAIVKRGVLAAFLDDVAGAAERKGKPTASAVRAERFSSERSFRAPPQATGMNLRFTGPRKPLDDLVADVERGVIIHDAMGAHTSNAASGDFSVNSSVLFAVEEGEITHAGRPCMVSGNLPAALARLGGLADDERDAGGGFSPVAIRVPTMRLDGVRVTSG